MRYLLSLFFAMATMPLIAQQQTILVEDKELPYYRFPATEEVGKGCVIFLHGAISQAPELMQATKVMHESLLEGNTLLLKHFREAGYDVLIPIATKEANWYNKMGQQFVQKLAEAQKDQQVILAGFSDGGTGAYKLFYQAPEDYGGLVVFNGYPQHENFYKEVDYTQVRNKPVLFFATEKDKVIPYEFLLVEYRRQRLTNPTTYFYLRSGGHWLGEYKEDDLAQVMRLLAIAPPKNEINQVYAPLDGFIVEGKVEQLYCFRQAVGKRFGMQAEVTRRSDYNHKVWKKRLEKGSIRILSTTLDQGELASQATIPFIMDYQGKREKIMLINWLVLPTW